MLLALVATLLSAAAPIPFELYRTHSEQNVYTTPPSALLKDATAATAQERAAVQAADGATLDGWWLAEFESRGPMRLSWTGPAETQVMLFVWSGERFWVYDFRAPGGSKTFVIDVPQPQGSKVYVRSRFATDALRAEPLPAGAPPHAQPEPPHYWLTIEGTEAPIATPGAAAAPPVKLAPLREFLVAACLGGEKNAGWSVLLAKVRNNGELVPLLPPPRRPTLAELAKLRWYQPGRPAMRARPRKVAASELVEEESARDSRSAHTQLGRCSAGPGELAVLASTPVDRAEWKEVARNTAPRATGEAEGEEARTEEAPNAEEAPELTLSQLAGTRTYRLRGGTNKLSCWSLGSDPAAEPTCAPTESDGEEGQTSFDSREEGWAKVAPDRWLGLRHVYFGGTDTLEVLLVDVEGRARSLRLELGTATD